MKPPLDLREKPFGKLKALERVVGKGRVRWICLCECGNTKIVRASHLTSGLVTSCGCNWHKKGESNPQWRGHGKISIRYWNGIIRKAKKRGLDFSVSIEDAWKLFQSQEAKCAWSGLPLNFRSLSKRSDGNASLDRIDSSKGYVLSNVAWVDKDVNKMKWDSPLDIFVKRCILVAENNKL